MRGKGEKTINKVEKEKKKERMLHLTQFISNISKNILIESTKPKFGDWQMLNRL